MIMFDKETLEFFYAEAEKECKSEKGKTKDGEKRKPPSQKQRDQGKKLAKEHGLQNQPQEKRQEIAEKGGKAKRRSKC